MCDSQYEYPLPRMPLWVLIAAGVVSAGVCGYAILVGSTASEYNQDYCFKTFSDFKNNCEAGENGSQYYYTRMESNDVSALSTISGLFAAAATLFFIVPCTQRRKREPAMSPSPPLLNNADGYYEPPGQEL